MTEHVAAPDEPAAAALVLAAGSSRRLGQPKQLLAYRGRTLLDTTLDVARAAPFAQRLVTVGGAAAEVRDTVDFTGFEVVNSVHFTDGCSSSIVSALDMISADSTGIVLMLGDQPHVAVETIVALIGAAAAPDQEGTPPPLAVCRYDDGIGHPFWFGRQVFDELANLHGDKGVWKLIESGRYHVAEVRIDGPIPLDVDTWDDYQALLAADVAQDATL